MKVIETTANNEVQPIASPKSKVETTTNTAKHNVVNSKRVGTGITENPPMPSTDAWDEVNTLRRALKENSRGYLASTAAVVISCCFLVSIAVGSLLAMPVVMVVATYDSLQRFFKSRKAAQESTTGATIAAELGLRVVSSSEVE